VSRVDGSDSDGHMGLYNDIPYVSIFTQHTKHKAQ
jgi:hypothetical protein